MIGVRARRQTENVAARQPETSSISLGLTTPFLYGTEMKGRHTETSHIHQSHVHIEVDPIKNEENAPNPPIKLLSSPLSTKEVNWEAPR